MNSKPLILLSLSLFIMTGISCNYLIRKHLGMDKNIDFFQGEKEIVKYYQPFTSKRNTNIYSFNSVKSFASIKDSISNYPLVYIENIDTKELLVINCHEDLKSTTADINNNDYKYLITQEKNKYELIKKAIEEKCYPIYAHSNNTYGNWSVYIISGTFFGEKIKSRFFSLTNINGISEINIVNLSGKQTDESDEE